MIDFVKYLAGKAVLAFVVICIVVWIYRDPEGIGHVFGWITTAIDAVATFLERLT